MASANHYGTDFSLTKNPIVNQKYHFNTLTDGRDCRTEVAEAHRQKAISYWNKADSTKGKGRGLMRIINNIIADFLYSVALKELGHGLHAIQDIEAHTPDYTQKFPIPGIEIYHHFDFPEADVAFTHKGEPDPRMLEAGVQSINYLGGFWEGVN